MAAIDKIYVNTYKEYLQFKEWCEQQPPLEDKYGKKVKITDYLFKYNKPFKDSKPIFSAPYYIDAYVIRNCPFDFIQEELMTNYGHWSQKRIKEFYEEIKQNGDKEYYYHLEDFEILEDGTMNIKGLKESSYSKIKRGVLYNSSTEYTYEAGKHFKCIKHPPYKYNTPYGIKNWFISIVPTNGRIFFYHREYDSWDSVEDFVDCNWHSSTAMFKTIKALKRHILKWKLPIGTIIKVHGRLISNTYEFIITK